MKTLLTTMAALVIAGGAQAATINFESNAAGDVITGFSAGGVTGSVSAVGGSNQAMVFDSNNYSGGDIDLAAPFYDSFTGRKRNARPAAGAAKLKPGNILIISEDGNSADPDDNGSGGTITFMFDQLIDFMGFDVFDDVDNFTVTADTGQSLGGINLAYDNQFQSFSNLGWTGVRSLTFDFKQASGAIDNLQFQVSAVPLPASLPLLIAGFGALGFASRRRKAA